MKIVGNKKTAFLISALFLILIVTIILGIIYLGNRKVYPENPLKMKNLGTSTVDVDISSMEIEPDQKDVPVYFVEPKIHISQVEELISKLSLSLERKDIVRDSYVQWSDGSNSFTYDSIQDTVSFQLTEGIPLERNEEAFSTFFSRYFDLEYDFTLINEKKNLDGGVTYYASRNLGDIHIQFGANYEYSDILKFNKEGDLESGILLLAEIEEYDFYLPIVGEKELREIVNIERYPKEHFVDTSVLMDMLNIDYLDDSWTEIEESVSDCTGGSSELIFLYKNSNQGYLLPVFKIFSTCKVVKSNSEYSVPTTFYVNAVNPSYVSL